MSIVRVRVDSSNDLRLKFLPTGAFNVHVLTV